MNYALTYCILIKKYDKECYMPLFIIEGTISGREVGKKIIFLENGP